MDMTMQVGPNVYIQGSASRLLLRSKQHFKTTFALSASAEEDCSCCGFDVSSFNFFSKRSLDPWSSYFVLLVTFVF